MSPRPEYITVGRFGRPRGYKGDIYITPETDDPERFLELTEVYVSDENGQQLMQLERVTMLEGHPVVKIKGYESREEAALLTNRSVLIPGEKARPLPEGSYYQFDLIGCRVTGIDGTDYGIVEEVLFYPANDLYRIKSERFGEVLFPAVAKFIVKVDIDNKEITIDPPAGLFEEENIRPEG